MSNRDIPTFRWSCNQKNNMCRMKEREVEMGILVLLLIGYVIWKCCNLGATSVQTKEDKEFEEMNLALKDADDDFDIF